MPIYVFVLLALTQLPATPAAGEETTTTRPWAPTPSMIEWLETRLRPVSASQASIDDAWDLHRMLVTPSGLGLRDDAAHSPTAAEAFARRRVDCVGFAFVYVGLARQLGLDASFAVREALRPGGTLGGVQVRESHMAVAVEIGGRHVILDHAGELPPAGFRRLSDDEAESLFWSNRGIRAAVAGRCLAGLTLLHRARRLSTAATVRLNLEVATRRCAAPGRPQPAASAVAAALR